MFFDPRKILCSKYVGYLTYRASLLSLDLFVDDDARLRLAYLDPKTKERSVEFVVVASVDISPL